MNKTLSQITLLFVASVTATLTLSSQASACDPGFDSMQFGGYARNVQQGPHGCSFQVELNYQVAPITVETGCPLYPGEVGNLVFKRASCSLTDGDEISGIMMLNRETGETRIE